MGEQVWDCVDCFLLTAFPRGSEKVGRAYISAAELVQESFSVRNVSPCGNESTATACLAADTVPPRSPSHAADPPPQPPRPRERRPTRRRIREQRKSVSLSGGAKRGTDEDSHGYERRQRSTAAAASEFAGGVVVDGVDGVEGVGRPDAMTPKGLRDAGDGVWCHFLLTRRCC